MVDQETAESYAPILGLIGKGIVRDPDWGSAMLEAVDEQLLPSIMRRRRDSATSLLYRINAGRKLACSHAATHDDWIKLAHACAEAHHIEEGIFWADRAVGACPDAAEYHRLRASLCERLHKYDEARASAGRAHALDPANVEIAADVERIDRAHLASLREIAFRSDLHDALPAAARLMGYDRSWRSLFRVIRLGWAALRGA